METLGSLIDKLSICKIREQHVLLSQIFGPLNQGSDLTDDQLDVASKSNKSQIEALKQEIDDWVADAVNGRLKNLLAPKNKLYYDSKDNIKTGGSISENIEGLFEANRRLWNFEDIRRQKDLPEDVRLQACDDVATWNQKRNQHMDEIDRLFEEKLKNSLAK